MGLFSKIKEGLKKTRDSVVGQIDSMLKSFTKIDDDLFEELEELLVMGDVGINTAQRICEELKARVKRDGVKDPNQIMGMLRNVVREMLEGDTSLHLATKPSIILVIGVNGVGKTTTIGKISARLTREGKKVVIAAADTFRAAAIDQLAVWADRSGARPGKTRRRLRPSCGGVRRDFGGEIPERGCDYLRYRGAASQQKESDGRAEQNRQDHRPGAAGGGKGNSSGAGCGHRPKCCEPGSGI